MEITVDIVTITEVDKAVVDNQDNITHLNNSIIIDIRMTNMIIIKMMI